MKEYEVLVEYVNPCGGDKHAKKEFFDVETADPEAWIRENGRYPILDMGKNADGDLIFMTGDGKGNVARYTFTE